MALTDKLSVVGQGIYNKINGSRTALGLSVVYYGDQQRIPKVPAVAVETSALERELAGIGGKGQTRNSFQVFVLCYLSRLQDDEITRLSVEQLSESIIDKLHEDVTLGGLVTHSFCLRAEAGYATRQDTLFRVVRILWQGTNKTPIA